MEGHVFFSSESIEYGLKKKKNRSGCDEGEDGGKGTWYAGLGGRGSLKNERIIFFFNATVTKLSLNNRKRSN